MTIKNLLYPVKIKKAVIKLEGGQWYLYQKSDRKILINYKTKNEALVAKEMHDWIRGVYNNKALQIKETKIWLENLKIEVPIYKLNKKNSQVIIRTSDIPTKIAKKAKIDEQKFVTYWYGKNAGGNKLITSK